MFCCAGFKNLIERAGRRGLSAVVLRFPQKKLGFLLQARAVALEDEGVIGPNHPLPVRLTVSSSIGLQYWPFCGQLLKKFLEKSPSEFEALARKHENLRPEGMPSG
jgi:hypothetical protein